MHRNSRRWLVISMVGGVVIGCAGSSLAAGDTRSSAEPGRSGERNSGGQFDNPDATRAVIETAKRELRQISESGKSVLRSKTEAGVKQIRDLGIARASDAQINSAVSQNKSDVADAATRTGAALDAAVSKWTRALTPRVGGDEAITRMNAGVAEMKADLARCLTQSSKALDDAGRMALQINKRPPEGQRRSDAPKPEGNTPGQNKPESSKPESTKPESSKPETNKPEAPKPSSGNEPRRK